LGEVLVTTRWEMPVQANEGDPTRREQENRPRSTHRAAQAEEREREREQGCRGLRLDDEKLGEQGRSDDEEGDGPGSHPA
jgi:hypothetical protein